MAKDDVLVVNATQMKTRQRTPGGKTTSYAVTTTVTSEPMSFKLDEAFVAKAAAEAITKQAREQTKAIAEPLSDEDSIKARRTVERAFAKGKPWALRRFSGGRTGITPPVVGENRKYNHSGRLADGLTTKYSDKTKEFYTNYPANRWNPKDFSSLARLETAFNGWVDRVPVLKTPRNDLVVQKALEDTHKQITEKHKMGTDHQAAIKTAEAAVKVVQLAARALGAG